MQMFFFPSVSEVLYDIKIRKKTVRCEGVTSKRSCLRPDKTAWENVTKQVLSQREFEYSKGKGGRPTIRDLVSYNDIKKFKFHLEKHQLYYFYRPRSEGDNALGSVRLSVCPSVCNALLLEPFDI